MAILLVIAAIIFICVAALIVRNFSSRSADAPSARDRFRHVGPGDAKPKEPRATGLD